MRYSLLLILALVGFACAGGAPTTVAAADDDLKTQSASTTVQSFTAVEGADLMARLDAAQARARSKQTPYWSAYTFDVRPGVAVDPAIREFNGSINTMGDTTVFVGTTASGQTVETRNLAIFLLRDPASNQITRMEIYNLERKREYSSYPVYWLGRANNEESLNYLRAIAAATPLDMLSERAVLGIALHDDSRVAGMLKNFVGSSPNQRIRSSSVYWLGQIGGEQIFLASLVRNESEDMKIRRSAVHAISQSRDQAAFTFLLGVAKNDANVELRKTAIRALGERGESAVDELLKLYDSETVPDVKRSVLQSLSEIKSTRVEDKLFEIARSNDNMDVRRQAIRLLGERAGKRSFDFLSATAQSTDANAEVQVQAVRAIGERRADESVPLLIKIAKTHPNQMVRKQAIRSLGESGDPRAVEFFREVLSKE